MAEGRMGPQQPGNISTEGPRLMRISLVRISLMRFFKTFLKYLPYANWAIYFISSIFWAKNSQKIRIRQIAVMK